MRRRTASVGLAAAALAAAAAGSASGATAARPTYANHVGPAFVSGAGEPSIGVSWKTGSTFLQAGLTTARVTFDAAGQPTWRDVSSLNTSLLTLDPIAATDSATGRTFVSQLVLASSLLAHTSDDGATWSSSTGSGVPAGFDHQTVGGGPYPLEGSSGSPRTSYPHAVYYCSQESATALCARSDDGGTTFGAGIPVYTAADCSGLHGHVRVGVDGTVFLPNKSCGGHQGVATSRDAGLSWTIVPLPGTSVGRTDPSVAMGLDGTTYAAVANGDGRALVSVSTDHGRSYGQPFDIGASAGVVNTSIPSAIAGDGDRAAVAFLGTTTGGDAQKATFGMSADGSRYEGGTYHLYVATTLDRGRTWTTVDLTPKDPVQRGRICSGGTTCAGNDRNLLDFMDITVDRQGRVLVGWADGCIGRCVGSDLVADNTYAAQGTVSRQVSGPMLFTRPAKVL